MAVAEMYIVEVNGKPTSMSLDEAARRHREMFESLTRTRATYDLEFAEWGWLLVQIKRQIPRGHWLTFLHRAKVHEKTAQRAMRIAIDCVTGMDAMGQGGEFSREMVPGVMKHNREGRRTTLAVLGPNDIPVGSARQPGQQNDTGVVLRDGLVGDEPVDMDDFSFAGGEQTARAGTVARVAQPVARAAGNPSVPGRSAEESRDASPVAGNAAAVEAARPAGRLGKRADMPGQMSWDEQFAAAAGMARSLAVMFDAHELEPEFMARFVALAREAGVKGGG